MALRSENKELTTKNKGQKILAIDIGNSTTKFGIFDGDEFVCLFSIPTVRGDSADEIYQLIKLHLNREISFLVISCVVTELENTYCELAEKVLNAKVLFVDNKFDAGLKIKYFPPENLGIDRLIAAFAAVEKYGKPIIVCDFGTATTIDAVNSDGDFLGGIIAPGMSILADVLFQKTSKLPKIEITKTPSIFGNSTITSIQAGIYYGYIGLVDGILRKMLDELDEKPTIIATGGLAPFITEGSALIEIVDKRLILDGLKIIFDKLS